MGSSLKTVESEEKKLSKTPANSVFKQQIEEESGRTQGEREAGEVAAGEDKGGEIFKEDMISHVKGCREVQ